MTLKEAIYIARKGYHNPYSKECIDIILNALLASQKAMKLLALNDSRIIGKLKQDARDAHKREREVFKRLSVQCNTHWNGKDNSCSRYGNPKRKCTLRNCPLLKGDDL